LLHTPNKAQRGYPQCDIGAIATLEL